MATVTRKGFVFMELGYTKDYSAEVWSPVWWHVRVDDNDRRVFVGEQEITIEVPDNFDPRPNQVAALEAQKRELAGNYQAAVTELNNRIANLQALTYEAAA